MLVAGRANVVAATLSRNVPVEAVVEKNSTIQNFSMHELANTRRHDILFMLWNLGMKLPYQNYLSR